MSVQIREKNITILLFADDKVIMVEKEGDMNYRKLVKKLNNWGSKIYLDKNKCMVIGKSEQDLEIIKKKLNTNRSHSNGMGPNKKYLLRKLEKGKAITNQLNTLSWSKNIRKATKTHLHKLLLESSVTYGPEEINSDIIKQKMGIETSLTGIIEKKTAIMVRLQ